MENRQTEETTTVLVLNRHEVKDLLDMDELIDSLSPAMAALSAGEVSMPPRIAAMIADRKGLLGAMPVYLGPSRTLEMKMVCVFPENERQDLPTHQALIVLFDASSGSPLAVMDGTHITAARTAAGSALATRLLASPEAEVLAVIGTGVQAHAHALAIPRVRSIKEIRIFGRNPEKADQLARQLRDELGIRVMCAKTFERVVSGAAIICATTSAHLPVVKGACLEPGMHVNSVGFHPEGGELDSSAIAKSLLVVESRKAALAPAPDGAGDLNAAIQEGSITEAHIHAEVGELVSGVRAGRTSPEQITLYKSVGVAVQDGVAAQLVYSAARKQEKGIQIEL